MRSTQGTCGVQIQHKKKKKSHHVVSQIWELQGYGIPVLGDVQSMVGEDPEQCDLSLKLD